jgi:hypothetical protein
MTTVGEVRMLWRIAKQLHRRLDVSSQPRQLAAVIHWSAVVTIINKEVAEQERLGHPFVPQYSTGAQGKVWCGGSARPADTQSARPIIQVQLLYLSNHGHGVPFLLSVLLSFQPAVPCIQRMNDG